MDNIQITPRTATMESKVEMLLIRDSKVEQCREVPRVIFSVRFPMAQPNLMYSMQSGAQVGQEDQEDREVQAGQAVKENAAVMA